MKVKELIAELQKLNEDAEVEVNDNTGGEVYPIVQVDFFEADEIEYGPVVIIQVNC